MSASLSHKKIIRITTVPMALRYLLHGQMRFMAQQGVDVVMISADGKELDDVIAYEGCRHIRVPMTRKITPIQDLWCLLKLVLIFRKEKPDIVHTHTPKAGLLGMLAAKICGIHVRIHTVAGLPMMVEKGMKYQLLKRTEKLTFAAANHVWPNSGSLLQYIKEKKLCNPAKLNIIANGSTNGINLQRFNSAALQQNLLQQTKTLMQFNPDKTYLLCIGRLVADKGIVELVDVFSDLYKKNNALCLILVGEFEEALDPLPAQTLQLINTHPGIRHINWTNQVEYFMHLAHLFVFPSHREGFPNVLLQAGAMGLPIICSAITGNIDIISHQQTGLLFEKGNRTEMLMQVSFALENNQTMLSMAKKLQQDIAENYRQENIWQKLLEAYKSLVN